MVQIDLPTLYGLKRISGSEYKPKRISMFPPSYADRAIARHLRREALRQQERDKIPADAAAAKDPSAPPEKLPHSNAQMQTDMTYCYHECPSHKQTTDPLGNLVTKAEDRAGGKKEGAQAQGKGGKEQKGKGKGQGKKETPPPVDADSDAGSEDEGDGATEEAKKPKGKRAKKNEAKETKGAKETNEGQESKAGKEPKDGEAFLPLFPLDTPHSSGTPFSLHVDPRVEQELQAARRFDEQYISQWLAQQGTPFQEQALSWLEERDSRRRALRGTAGINLPATTLNPLAKDGPPEISSLPKSAFRQDGSAIPKHVSFAKENFVPGMGFSLPYTPQTSRPWYNFPQQSAGFSPDPFLPPSAPLGNQGPIVVYRDGENKMRSADGRDVIFITNHGQSDPESSGQPLRVPLQPMMSGGLNASPRNSGHSFRNQKENELPTSNSYAGPSFQRSSNKENIWGPQTTNSGFGLGNQSQGNIGGNEAQDGGLGDENATPNEPMNTGGWGGSNSGSHRSAYRGFTSNNHINGVRAEKGGPSGWSTSQHPGQGMGSGWGGSSYQDRNPDMREHNRNSNPKWGGSNSNQEINRNLYHGPGMSSHWNRNQNRHSDLQDEDYDPMMDPNLDKYYSEPSNHGSDHEDIHW